MNTVSVAKLDLPETPNSYIILLGKPNSEIGFWGFLWGILGFIFAVLGLILNLINDNPIAFVISYTWLGFWICALYCFLWPEFKRYIICDYMPKNIDITADESIFTTK